MTLDRNTTVKTVLRLLEARGDLPALAQAVGRVTSLAESDEGSARELAAAILDDYTLTQKVLRIVNSPLYPQVQEVSTVSRAIVVLGWNEVQRLALTLKLFEAFPTGDNETEVKNRLARSFLGGILAKNISTAMGQRDAEQVFICGLFHAFGELLVAAYMPEKEAEGRALAERHRLPAKSAIRIALGLTYSELGMAVAEKLHFPESLVSAMQKNVRPKIAKKPKVPELQCGLANLGYELGAMLLSDPSDGKTDRRPELQKLLKDFEEQYGPANIELKALVDGSLADLSVQAKMLELPIATKKLEECADRAMGGASSPAAAAVAASEATFAKGIAETMRSLVQESSLSEVLLVVLGTIHTGLKDLGLRRVVFALRDPKEPMLRYRSGLGVDLNEASRWFDLPLSGHNDPISAAMRDGKDRSIARLGPNEAWPANLKNRAPNDANFILLPIVVADKPIGLFYVEGTGGQILDRAHLGALKTLRDQVVIAISRSSRAAA